MKITNNNEDSLASAYEFELDNLYQETGDLNNKIKKILVMKEKKKEEDLKNYHSMLSNVNKKVFQTVRNKLFEKNYFLKSKA